MAFFTKYNCPNNKCVFLQTIKKFDLNVFNTHKAFDLIKTEDHYYTNAHQYVNHDNWDTENNEVRLPLGKYIYCDDWDMLQYELTKIKTKYNYVYCDPVIITGFNDNYLLIPEPLMNDYLAIYALI